MTNMKKWRFKNQEFKADLNRPYLTQSDIARKTGISQAKVSRILNAETFENLSLSDFTSICELTKRTPFEYFERAYK